MTELDRIVSDLRIRMKLIDGGMPPSNMSKGTKAWLCIFAQEQLHGDPKLLKMPFYTNGPKPTAADVLANLAVEASVGEGSLREFKEDFGPIDAEQSYRKCRATAFLLRNFLGNNYLRVISAKHSEK